MARMSRKALEKRIDELENAVRSLSQMHGYTIGTMTAHSKYMNESIHPKTEVDLRRYAANTSYGRVGIEDLARFVVDGEPLKFKMEDKELVKEVYPDGSVLDVVKNKKKKLEPKIIPTYPLEGPYEMLKEMYSWSVK